MKESSSSPWFASRLLNAGATSCKPRPGKQTPPSRVGPCSTAPERSHPPSSAYSFSCHHRSPVTSPFRSSLVVIPFSWEKQPGVPKHHCQPSKDQNRKLPLPPPLSSNSEPFLPAPRRRKGQDPRPAADPFALAMMACTREEEPAADDDRAGGLYWKGSPTATPKAPGCRRKAAGERFGFVDLYGSCKKTCSVADSAVPVPRSGRRVAAYGLVTRRAG